MNKPATLLLSSIALACLSPAVDAAARQVEGDGIAALAACPTNLTRPTIYHFDKVVFVLGGPLTAALQEDQVALNNLPRNAPLDVKLRDNPSRVAHIEFKVLTFLGAAPTTENLASMTLISVAYSAVVCPAGTTTPAQ